MLCEKGSLSSAESGEAASYPGDRAQAGCQGVKCPPGPIGTELPSLWEVHLSACQLGKDLLLAFGLIAHITDGFQSPSAACQRSRIVKVVIVC